MTKKENRRKLIAGSAILVMLLSIFFASAAFAGRAKITICHVPPGNPDNPQTITIGEPAVRAHLRLHDGDSMGACTGCPAGWEIPGGGCCPQGPWDPDNGECLVIPD